jgi:hypothetical protein
LVEGRGRLFTWTDIDFLMDSQISVHLALQINTYTSVADLDDAASGITTTEPPEGYAKGRAVKIRRPQDKGRAAHPLAAV